MDLLGPVQSVNDGDSFLIFLTDTHTRYTQLATLANIATITIANAIFQHWICLFGTPLQIAISKDKRAWTQILQQLQC